MNSSLSHHRFSAYNSPKTPSSPISYSSNKCVQFTYHKEDPQAKVAIGNRASIRQKSHVKRDFQQVFIRVDSVKHLEKRRKDSNMCENMLQQYHLTEKMIKTNYNKSKGELLYETSSTMKQIQNNTLVRKSSFYPSKNNKKRATRSSILVQRKIDGDSFDIIKPIGKGKYGKVFLVRQKQTGFVLALKAIEKKKLIQSKLLEQFIRQLKIQFYLDHPGIVKLYGFFDDQQNFYLLMELGCDGQLYDKISDQRLLTQESSSYIARSMLEIVQYMHSEKVLHRDIKPQNIVIVMGNLKICDFGWAVYNDTEMRTTFCGTPLYFSPELLSKQEYDQKVDLWAIGIMTYQLVVGKSPFNLKQPQDLARIITHEVQFPKNKSLSHEFKSFISKILQKDPQRRPTSKQLLETSFIKHYSKLQICQELCRLDRKSVQTKQTTPNIIKGK